MSEDKSVCSICANIGCKLSGTNARTFFCLANFIPRKKSNREMLNGMSDEELAEFIYKDAPSLYMRTPKEIVEWLREGADE